MKKTTNKSAPARASSPCTQTVEDSIRTRIFTIRGVQVMLSPDLAALYDVEVKYLHRQVKRNASRFPLDFVMHLSPDEAKSLRCQNVTSKRGGDRYGLWAFTEQGIAMLSSVLKSDRAAEVNVAIMRAFVAMRRSLMAVGTILARVEAVEQRQDKEHLQHIVDQSRNDERQRLNEERFETIFKAMGEGDFPPQKVFCDGRHYDAYSFARKLVRKAAHSIVLVDGYCDDVTLDILSCKRGGVKVTIATVSQTPITATAVMKFNKQNPPLEIRATGAFHDRFLILDGKELYHFGASLKDLGRHYCAVSKLDAAFIPSILGRFPQE